MQFFSSAEKATALKVLRHLRAAAEVDPDVSINRFTSQAVLLTQQFMLDMFDAPHAVEPAPAQQRLA